MNGNSQSHENAIVLDKVSKAFGPRKVLQNVSFRIATGTAFVLMGRSGTGKSVTLKLICGLLKADSGSVSVNSEDITHLSSSELAGTRQHNGLPVSERRAV